MGYIATGKPVGRPKQFYKYELPSGVVKVVRAQCSDYFRKELAIKTGLIAQEVLQAYINTNEAISSALSEIEESCRGHFLMDIADNKGYDNSQSQNIFSYNSYYQRKRKAIYDIAKNLLLVE